MWFPISKPNGLALIIFDYAFAIPKENKTIV
jgi:hypothetical protein